VSSDAEADEENDEEAGKEFEAVVVDMSAVTDMDYTAATVSS